METGRLEPTDTATQILDVAERLVQVRGFNGFSYADVSAELKITKAALHYHFASKSELGEALVSAVLHPLRRSTGGGGGTTADAPARLGAYADLYLDVLRNRRMCLCGMMAAEYETFPAAMQETVVRFFDDNETWLARVLKKGREEGNPGVHGVTERGGPNDRWQFGRRHARRPTIWRHRKFPSLSWPFDGRSATGISNETANTEPIHQRPDTTCHQLNKVGRRLRAAPPRGDASCPAGPDVCRGHMRCWCRQLRDTIHLKLTAAELEGVRRGRPQAG